MNETNDLERVLDDCLQKLMGGASLDDCLRRYPAWAGELKPMLEVAAELERGRQLSPSRSFKMRARARLSDYWQAHPRRRGTPSLLSLQLLGGIAVVLVVLMLAGTAYAQNALPGEPVFYEWKIVSEKAWRALAPNPVAVDVSIANRRADELTAVVEDQKQLPPGQAKREADALQSYYESLQQLQIDSNASDTGQIMQVLESHRKKFSAAGIDDPELDAILHGNSGNSGGLGGGGGNCGGQGGGGGGGGGGGNSGNGQP